MAMLAPSLLSANFLHLKEELDSIEQAKATWIHLDVMDGHFAPDLFLGPKLIRDIRMGTSLFLDTHLMVDNPERFVDCLAEAGSDALTFHWEATNNPAYLIKMIRAQNKKVGIAINPETSVSCIAPFLGELDLVLVMAISPGRAGSPFQIEAHQKMDELLQLRQQEHSKFLISVDGGIGTKEIAMLKNKVDILVSGSGFFGAMDRSAFVESVQY